MRVNGILLVVLGMSLSFAAILGTLGAFSAPSNPGKARRQLRVLEPPPRQALASVRNRQARANAVEEPAAESVSASEASDSPAPTQSTIGRIETLEKSLTSPSKQLDNVHAELQRDLASLKRNRDLMLDDLATELGKMTPETAAGEIRLLDSESVKLTLSRLTPARRKAIRRALDSTRAGVLYRNQRSLAAKRR